MNWRNVPGYAWLLSEWIADVMNHTWEVPWLETSATSSDGPNRGLAFCYALFWDVVYVTRHKDSHIVDRLEATRPLRSGTIRGILQTRWTRLTFKILTDDTKKIIHRSRVRLGRRENNLKLDTNRWNPNRVFIKSKRDSEDENVILPTDLTFNPFNTPDEHLPKLPRQAWTRKLGAEDHDTDCRRQGNRETNGRPTMSVPCPTSRWKTYLRL
jgi:hypothetical protein